MRITYKKLLFAIAFFATASAQSQSTSSPPVDSGKSEPAAFKFRPPAGGSLNDCIKFVETDGETGANTITMESGEKLEFTRQSANEPAKVKAISKDGETLADQIGLEKAVSDIEKIPDEVARDKNYVAVRARLHSAMKNMIKKDCAVFTAKKSFRPLKLPQVGVYDNPSIAVNSQNVGSKSKDIIASTDLLDNGGGLYDPSGPFGPGGDYGGGSGGFGNGGYGYDGSGGYSGFSTQWSQADFNAFADDFIANDFAWSMNQFVTTNTLNPRCGEVIIQCTAFCQSLGNYETTACVALGGAAAFLNIPIGIAVGSYCSGKVWVATEQCKQNCYVVPVPCH